MRFYNLQFTIYNRRKAAFTLVEILIVTAILGILAAIVIPEFQAHATQAKEAAAKESLRMLREAIDRYTLDNPRLQISSFLKTNWSQIHIIFQSCPQIHLMDFQM
jgi:prepilin-type N-terminal cleavage/methylation domain-containing protein